MFNTISRHSVKTTEGKGYEATEQGTITHVAFKAILASDQRYSLLLGMIMSLHSESLPELQHGSP